MTTHFAHPGHHISTKSAAAALAGGALAVAAGFGVAMVVTDEATPVPIENRDVVPGDGAGGSGSVDSDGLSGINRDELRPPTSEERYWQHKFEQMR